MSQLHDAWAAKQRARWIQTNPERFLRPDAHRFIRHDAYRFFRPGYVPDFGDELSALALRYTDRKTRTSAPREFHADVARGRDVDIAIIRARWQFAALRFELALQRFEQWRRKAGFNPDQPRVPAGNLDGGQWTSEGGGGRVRLAASDKPRLGRAAAAALALELAKRAIEAYRSENFLRDLFGSKTGTVTHTNFNGEDIFGSNSTSPTYSDGDRAAAESMRSTLVEKYPDVMQADQIGQKPNDALFHAETTVLLRAAKANGGSLAGQALEVFSDRPMCSSCGAVLPLVGRELDNPTVTFVEPSGQRSTMRNGAWIR